MGHYNGFKSTNIRKFYSELNNLLTSFRRFESCILTHSYINGILVHLFHPMYGNMTMQVFVNINEIYIIEYHFNFYTYWYH